ncbi:MAG: hypothetical protein ABI547_02505 [Betaproteobacteria bacterium]
MGRGSNNPAQGLPQCQFAHIVDLFQLPHAIEDLAGAPRCIGPATRIDSMSPLVIPCASLIPSAAVTATWAVLWHA